jgi:large subunit ribosomal protein L14e
MTVNVKLEPGDIVRSLRGRDEGQLAIVIALVEERFALVADGDKRRFDRPKRKNVLHLEPIGTRSEEVANSLRDTGRVTNAKLRYAIGKIEQRLETHAVEKGE